MVPFPQEMRPGIEAIASVAATMYVRNTMHNYANSTDQFGGNKDYSNVDTHPFPHS